jgi:hypothetical protein
MVQFDYTITGHNKQYHLFTSQNARAIPLVAIVNNYILYG